MKLSDAAVAKLIETMEKRWTESRKCPVCGASDWSIDNTVFQLPEFKGDGPAPANTVKPLIAVMCKKCSYTITMNAIHLGVVPPDKKEDSK